MSVAEIVLAPGSFRPISLDLSDGVGGNIDFTVGTWSCFIKIVPYPTYDGVPFATLSTLDVEVLDGPKYEWLTLTSGSEIVLSPDGLVTSEWRWSRYHYDCFLTGPNLTSKPDRVGHGPFKMDW